MNRFISCSLFLLLPLLVNAQEKIEVEERVKERNVPVNLIDWVDHHYPKAGKRKWYLEKNQTSENFEVKLEYQEKEHSVEFDNSGALKDIEIELSEKELEDSVVENIHKSIDSIYSTYKIRRIQLQVSGTDQAISEFLNNNIVDGLSIHYEIEYLGKFDVESTIYEGLFDSEGKIISTKKVIIHTTDNMNY